MRPLPQFDRPNDAELQWLQSSIEGAKQLIARFSPSDSGQPITSAALDSAWAAWLATTEKDVNRINEVINSIGLAFGQILVDTSGFEWVVASDEKGCDMAILALPGKGDVLSYPLHVIAHRWPNRETFFLEAVEEFLKKGKEETAESYEKAVRQGEQLKSAGGFFSSFVVSG